MQTKKNTNKGRKTQTKYTQNKIKQKLRIKMKQNEKLRNETPNQIHISIALQTK